MLQEWINRLRRRPQPRRALPPQWRVLMADIDGELCDPAARTFFISPYPTPEAAELHALAHLYLGHHETDADDFTEQDCRDADDTVHLWRGEFNVSSLDDLPTHDGPPTLTGITG